jgi:hypothetical protein
MATGKLTALAVDRAPLARTTRSSTFFRWRLTTSGQKIGTLWISARRSHGFVLNTADRLASDNVVEAARAELGALLREWTARFAIVQFDKSACASKGWSLGHFDLVEMSETVCEMLCDLVRYTRHADIAEQFIVDLVDFDANPVVAAWLLELIRSREDVAYRPPRLPCLEEASIDHRLLRTAYEATQTNEQIRESSPTYWRDTLSKLGIA